MSKSQLKGLGIACCVVCFILLFVACERYQANVAAVNAMNEMASMLMPGQAPMMIQPGGPAMTLNDAEADAARGITPPRFAPGVPVITTYAIFFTFMFAAGALVCFYHVNAMSLAEKQTAVSAAEPQHS